MAYTRRWSPEELEFLKDSWATRTIPGIAGKLGRSVEAVKLKAGRLGLGRHIHCGTDVTLCRFFRAIGLTYNSRTRARLMRHGLPVRYRVSVRRRYAMINIDRFWIWAEQHRDLIDFSRIDVNILGQEPDWVCRARAAAYDNRRNTRPWSPAEDSRLKGLLGQYRYDLGQLARLLDRSEGAVKRRICTLGLKARPCRNRDRPWTEQEIRSLVELRIRGFSWDEVGRRLGRSGQSARGRYERLMNPGRDRRSVRRSGGCGWTGIRALTARQLGEKLFGGEVYEEGSGGVRAGKTEKSGLSGEKR